MTTTPWGDSKELGERRLPPGPGTPREEVERNQRERLFGATVAVTTSKGYAATSVADLVELSGVSRSTFYRHFDSKLACFLATMEEILATVTAVAASRLRRPASWEEGAERALHYLLELIVAQPAGARLCLVEAEAAGPEASARLEEAVASFQALMEEAFECRPGYEGMPEEIVGAMVGGTRRMIHTRLQQGTERELLKAAPELLELGLSFLPPPKPLRERRSKHQPTDAPMEAGPRARAGDAGERIARATLATVAAKGYPETSIADITAAANVSRSTFYKCFDGKEQALLSALFACRLALQAAALPAYRRARNWSEGMRAAVGAACAFLESEPDLARVVAMHVHAAGPAVLKSRNRTIEALQAFVEEGFVDHGPTSAIAPEAIVAGVYSLFCQRVQAGGPRNLRGVAPVATYTILVPFLGPECACAVARGETATLAPDLAG